MGLTPMQREWVSIGHPKTEKNPKGSGRHKLKIDWGLVQYLAHIHCTPQEIAAAIGIHYNTLWQRCAQEHGRPWGEVYAEWKDGGKASLRHKQWQLAESNASMAIYLGKNYLGQTDGLDMDKAKEFIQEIVNYGDREPKTWNDDKKLDDKSETPES